jgi:type II secretion system (T2SS) protein E
MRRIGELLVADGSLTEASVARALHYQRMSGSGLRLGTILLNWDLLAEEALIEQLARMHRCDPVPWTSLAAVSRDVARLLPPAAAIRLEAIPYGLERGAVRVAFLNPSNLAAVDETASLLRKRVLPGVTSEVRLLQAHHKFYGRHMTQETKALIHKLQRRASAAPDMRMRTAGEVKDFRAPDLVQWEHGHRDVAGGPPAPPASSARRDTSSHDAARSRPTKPRGLPPPPDFFPAKPVPDFTIPTFPAPVASAAPPEESLSDWVGEALGSFQKKEGLAGASPVAPEEPTDVPILAEAPGAVSGETNVALPEPAEAIDLSVESLAAEPAPAQTPHPEPAPAAPVNGTPGNTLWRASRVDDADDAVVSGMWTAPDALPAAVPYPEGQSREEIAAAVVEEHLRDLPRCLVLGADRSGTVAWYARAEGMSNSPEVWIPSHERSIVGHVLRTGTPHFGPLEPELWPRALSDLLGARPAECAVFPVRVGDSVTAFLYADRLGEPMLYEDFGLLTRAASFLAASLSRFLLNSNSSSTIH